MQHRRFFATVLVFAGCLSAWSASAQAQTGPDLLVKPWLPGEAVSTNTDALLEPSGTTGSGADERLSIYHSLGRWRLFPDSDATPRIGYEATYLDIDTNDHSLPRHLTSVELGFAQPVALVNDWFVAVTGAAGYAGVSPFDDNHAWYPAVNVIGGRVFNKDEAFLVALNYNGNRTFLPDAPIPGFALAGRYDQRTTFVIGVPYSSITYEPVTGLQIEGGFSLVTTLEANVGYAFTKHFSLFAQYNDELEPFHVDRTNADDRLFFESRQAEAGLRYSFNQKARLSASAGYAFDQEFSHGYDVRNLDPTRRISDEPFLRLRLELGF